MGTHIPANIKALVIGQTVSGLLGRSKSGIAAVGWTQDPHVLGENFHSHPCPAACMETKTCKVRADECFRPLSSRHLCSTHFCSPFISIPFAFSPFFPNIQGQITATAPSFRAPKDALFIIFLGPLWPRCKIYRMIFCCLSHSISTSQASMLFN